MDPNENTKSGPEQEQPQSPALQDSASQADELDRMKAESPRKCEICGSPNHHGCGCEAKRQAKAIVEIKNIDKAEQPLLTPAEEQKVLDEALDEDVDKVLSAEGIIESHNATMQMAKDIRTMVDAFEGLCAAMYDSNNYLKIIAAAVFKKTETEASVGCILTIQGCIEKGVTEIYGMLKEVKERMDKDAAAKNQN